MRQLKSVSITFQICCAVKEIFDKGVLFESKNVAETRGNDDDLTLKNDFLWV